MMKKLYRFFCSMRFGMILLLLIAVLCVAATVTGRDSIYSSPLFIALFAIWAGICCSARCCAFSA